MWITRMQQPTVRKLKYFCCYSVLTSTRATTLHVDNCLPEMRKLFFTYYNNKQ